MDSSSKVLVCYATLYCRYNYDMGSDDLRSSRSRLCSQAERGSDYSSRSSVIELRSRSLYAMSVCNQGQILLMVDSLITCQIL